MRSLEILGAYFLMEFMYGIHINFDYRVQIHWRKNKNKQEDDGEVEVVRNALVPSIITLEKKDPFASA